MEKLVKLRKSKNFTQIQLADLIGVKPNTISQYELGKRQPNILILKKIANVLNCSVEELIEEN